METLTEMKAFRLIILSFAILNREYQAVPIPDWV
jgi:hypothetical protein